MDTNKLFQISGNAAERYEDVLVPVIFIPWAEHLIGRAGLKPGDRVLDVACGTGIVARKALERVGPSGRVAGADINAGMLAVAGKLEPEGRIEWITADAANIPVEDQSFDVAFCQQGLQFFPDKPAAAAELRRVLGKGGTFHACVLGALADNPLINSQAKALENHLGPAAAGTIQAACGWPDAQEIDAVFRGAGFAEVSVEPVTLTLTHPDGRAFIAGMLASTPLAATIGELPEEKRDAITQDVLKGFGDYYDGTGLKFPHLSNVITARA